MNKIISINNLKKNYLIRKSLFNKSKNENINALNNITLDVFENETIGLIGLNGAGKSTLIKTILGILKQDKGEIKVFENNPFDNRIKNLYNIGVVFGQKTQLKWDLSPLDSYKLNKYLYSIDNEVFKERLEKYIDILELKSFIDRPVRTLSLGQKMRAELVSALLHKPKLLILDEPTIGIDFLSKKKIIDLIKELKKYTTIVFTSHNLNEVYEISDRIVILHKGKILIDETKDKLSKKSDYVSLKLYLNKEIVYEDSNFKDVIKNKENEYEYQFNYIPKEKIKEFIDYIYSNNDVNYFEIIDNNLEKIIKDLYNEHN